MSEQSPTWYITRQPNTDWSEANAARFDGATWFRHPISIGVDHPHYQPPLHPQQPTPEQIADAACDALADIETALAHWMFPAISDMSKLRALRDVLKPPAPKWEPRKGGDF